MSRKNSMRQLAATAAQATSPPTGVASSGDATVAYTSTKHGPGSCRCAAVFTDGCQLAQAPTQSHEDV